MKYKLNKSKGFTLIELMVVISIIALLSSVVLASLKGAREKAVLTKTVSEMKSLQQAVELYRSDKGFYPPGVFDESNDHSNPFAGYDWDGNVQTLLVNNKYIANIPHAPNPTGSSFSGDFNNGYFLGYVRYSDFIEYIVPPLKYTCGRNDIKNYAIYFMANNKKLNLPLFEYFDGSNYYNSTINSISSSLPPYTYCISM